MGILDQVIGGILNNSSMGSGSQSGYPQSGLQSGLGGVLMSLLGGGQQNMAQSPMQGESSGIAGALGSLLGRFQQAGLGNIAQSWIGNGPNQPVSPQQLRNVFGDNDVQDMAGRAGMPAHDFLSQLSQHLPRAVDGLTPNGTLPDEGTVSV